MAWSGGNFTRANPTWVSDASSLIGIEPVRHDAQDNDFTTGINECLNKTGQNGMTGALSMGTNKITNLAAGTLRNDAAQVGQVQDGASSYLGTTGGTSTAFTVTATPTITALVTGAQYSFKANAANGVAATLKIDGTTATTMQRQGTALVGNEFIANDIVTVVYNGTNFQITNIATAPLYVDRTNNRVGINTTAPANGFNVVQYDSFSGNLISGLFQASKVITSDAGVSIGSTNGNAPFIAATKLNNGTGTATSLTFKTNATDRVVIGTNGDIGINTPIPGYRLQVSCDTYNKGIAITGDGVNIGAFLHFLDNGTQRNVIHWDVGGFVSGSVNSLVARSGATGGVYLAQTGTSWIAVSDGRYKKNVQDLEYGLNEISQLRPVRFDYTDDETDNSSRLGFIAQEVQPLIPEVVQGSEELKLGLSLTELIPALVNSIKELNAKVEALEARIAVLEA